MASGNTRPHWERVVRRTAGGDIIWVPETSHWYGGTIYREERRKPLKGQGKRDKKGLK